MKTGNGTSHLKCDTLSAWFCEGVGDSPKGARQGRPQGCISYTQAKETNKIIPTLIQSFLSWMRTVEMSRTCWLS